MADPRTPAAPRTQEWTLTDRGRSLLVRQGPAGQVEVTVDGDPVLDRRGGPLDTLKADLGSHDGMSQRIVIDLDHRRRVRKAVLAERGEVSRVTTSFVPPEGSRARRLYDLRAQHPHAYAARHVAFTVIGFLGIGALVSALFSQLWSRIDWSWLPELSLPTPPDWLRYLNPFYWLRSLFELIGSMLPDWSLPELAIPGREYVVPLLIATAVAVREVRRRRAREQREAHYERATEDSAAGAWNERDADG